MKSKENYLNRLDQWKSPSSTLRYTIDKSVLFQYSKNKSKNKNKKMFSPNPSITSERIRKFAAEIQALEAKNQELEKNSKSTLRNSHLSYFHLLQLTSSRKRNPLSFNWYHCAGNHGWRPVLCVSIYVLLGSRGMFAEKRLSSYTSHLALYLGLPRPSCLIGFYKILCRHGCLSDISESISCPSPWTSFKTPQRRKSTPHCSIRRSPGR